MMTLLLDDDDDDDYCTKHPERAIVTYLSRGNMFHFQNHSADPGREPVSSLSPSKQQQHTPPFQIKTVLPRLLQGFNS